LAQKNTFKFFLSLLLPKSSTFMHLSITDKCHQGDESRVRMPEFSSKYFAMYWQWVHTSRLDYKVLDYSTRLEPAEPRFIGLGYGQDRKLLRTDYFNANLQRVRTQSGKFATRLIKLWMLADLLGDPELQDVISKELARWFLGRDIPADIPLSAIALPDDVDTTARDCPLRQLCIDWVDGLGDQSRVVYGIEEGELEWLVSGLSGLDVRRRKGELEDDPRMMDLTSGERYKVRTRGQRRQRVFR
jgi:hypothetical protein